MGLSFTRAISKESHHLEGEIESYIGEDEEELFSTRCKESLASSSESSFFLNLLFSSINQKLLRYLSEGRNEILEIKNRYSRESTKDSRRLHSFFEI